MSYIITLVAADPKDAPVADRHINEVEGILKDRGIMRTCADVWLGEGKAVDIGISENPSRAIAQHIRGAVGKSRIDVFVTNIERRQKKLLVADMDSTIVHGETLDELAEHAGIKDKIADITERAMNGELEFESALRERVSLLKNLSEDALKKTVESLKFNPGAQALVRNMKKHGAFCVLVSGGFTYFTEAIAKKAGFDKDHGNILDIVSGVLTGKVKEPVLDKYSKVDILELHLKEQGLKTADSLAVGDGANDVPMLAKAGLGVGYRPKPVVAKEVDNVITHGDLSALLYAQGYREKDIT